MKKLLILPILIALISCDDAYEPKIASDPYSGRYRYESVEHELEIEFTLTRRYGVYFGDAVVDHPEISKHSNIMVMHNFTGKGFRQMFIREYDASEWRIEMYDTEFTQEGGMFVKEIHVSIPGVEPFTLHDQMFQ